MEGGFKRRHQKKSANANTKLLQCKRLMQAYITPVRLNKYNSNILDTCFKCSEAQGALVHCVWEFDRIKNLWREVINTTMVILPVNIPLDSKMILMHLYPTNLHLKNNNLWTLHQHNRLLAFDFP